MLPKSLRPLLPYLKKYRWGYVWGTICVFCNNGVWIFFPQVIRRAIDDLHLGVTRHKLFTYALLLMAVAGVKSIFQFLTRWVVIGISRENAFTSALKEFRRCFPTSRLARRRTSQARA